MLRDVMCVDAARKSISSPWKMIWKKARKKDD